MPCHLFSYYYLLHSLLASNGKTSFLSASLFWLSPSSVFEGEGKKPFVLLTSIYFNFSSCTQFVCIRVKLIQHFISSLFYSNTLSEKSVTVRERLHFRRDSLLWVHSLEKWMKWNYTIHKLAAQENHFCNPFSLCFNLTLSDRSSVVNHYFWLAAPLPIMHNAEHWTLNTLVRSIPSSDFHSHVFQ